MKVHLSRGQCDTVAAGKIRGTPAGRTAGVVELAVSSRVRIVSLLPAFVLVDRWSISWALRGGGHL